MQLNYSFNGIEPLLYPGNLPFSDMHTERVKVAFSGVADSSFPPLFMIGDLLCHHRPSTNESGITLLLTYQAGVTPPSNEPVPTDKWVPVPNSPIYGQIRIALTCEAIKQIRKVTAEGHDYELTLSNVQFNNVTRNG